MTEINLNRMKYIRSEDNNNEWYEDFIIELHGPGLSEYTEKKNISYIIKETKNEYSNKDDKGKGTLYLRKVKEKF